MKFASLKSTVCGLAIALGLCQGATLSAAEILITPPLPALQSFGDVLHSSFLSATNGHDETNLDNFISAGNYSAPGPQWHTNGIFYNLVGHTALAVLLAPEVPATALTRRVLVVRGHDNGATNVTVDPAAFHGHFYQFLSDANVTTNIYVQAAFKRYGGGYDYCLLLLSNSLPASIATMRMVDPAAFDAKVSDTHAYWWPNFNPLLGTCQHNICGTLFTTASGHSMLISGDSGSPNFYAINGEAFYYAGRTTSGYSSQMQADCDTLTTWAGLNPADHQFQLLELTQF